MKRFFARRRGTKQSLILLAGVGVAAAALLFILFAYPWSPSSPSESPVFVPLTSANKNLGAHTRATITARGDWEYPPFEFLDESGQPAGFNVDILTRVADIMNLDVRINLGPWDEVRQQLEDGEIDVLAGMYKTDSRDRKVDFSIPHFITSYGVFIPADSDIRSIEDIRDRRILVQTGDLAHDYLVENEIGAELVTMQEWDSVLSALVEGRADCAVMGMVQGVNLLSQREYRDIRVLSQPLLQRPYCIAVQEGDAELLATLNDGLNLLKTSGEYDEIHEEWFGVYDELRTFERPILRVLAAGILALGLVLVLILFWSHSLRKQVHKQTANLTATMQELEAANSTKDRFLASVSHELRTPLHGIIGMTELMEKTELDARQSELLEMMNTAASQLYRVISDLIDTSKMNTRQLSLKESTFSLSDLSSWLEPVLRGKAEEKGLALTIAASGDTKATFRSDKERIAQIVINLADNAIKNTDSGAVDVRLHLHAGEAPETTDIAEAGVLDIVVHDSGSGIPYEEQDEIFAPFKQVSAASGELSPGLGLGLSIVKSITDLLAGSIEVSSTPGEGSNFSVRLPVEMTGAEAEAQAEPGPEAGPGLRAGSAWAGPAWPGSGAAPKPGPA
ncbi:MAG: transporter substrate-binding domain-containing protein, partial [Spirochaetia bacterium]